MATIKLRDVNPVVLDHNLGLGDPAPDEKLVISLGSLKIDDSGDGQGIKFVSNSPNKNKLGLYWFNRYNNANTTLWQLLNDEDANATNDLNLRNTAGDSVLRITQDGKIGCGVDGVLQARFHIGGAAGGEIRLSNSSIGDDASSGTSIKAAVDKHFYINNIENTGGLFFQTQGSTALYINQHENVSVGGVFEHTSPSSKFVIGKVNISEGTSEGLLHLHGQFNQSTIDIADRIAIRTTLWNSSSVGRIDDPIKFATDGAKTYTLLNQDNGSVGIGGGITTPNGTLEVAQGGDAVKSSIRIFAQNADAYLSFGDDNKDWYVGIDESDSSKFKIGLGSGAPASVGSINIDSSNNRVGIRDTGPSHTLTVAGDFRVWGDDSGTARGIILSYSNGNDSGIIDTTSANTHLEFRIGNATKGWLTTSGYFLVGNINSTASWNAAALEVDGPILAKGNTAVHAGYLFREDSNTGMMNTAANTLAFFTGANNQFQIGPTGKWTIGPNKKPVIRHHTDLSEGANSVSVKGAVDHAADVVLYSVDLGDIQTDDILDIHVNWGVSHGLAYQPSLHYGLILATGSSIDYGDSEENGSGVGAFIKIMNPQDHEATQKEHKGKNTSVSYKLVADDFSDARMHINFVVFADNQAAAGGDDMSFTEGRMTVTHIRGYLTD